METTQPQTLPFKGAPMKMDDERLNKTHDNHVFIALKVEEGQKQSGAECGLAAAISRN